MKLLLDEMHAIVVAETLRQEGLDVLAVAERPELRGCADDDILVVATGEGRAVVTENIRDFAPLAQAWALDGRPHPGIVLTHPRRFARATLAYPGVLITALRAFATDPPITGDSWLWWLD